MPDKDSRPAGSDSLQVLIMQHRVHTSLNFNLSISYHEEERRVSTSM